MRVTPLFRSLLLSSVSMVFVDIGYAADEDGQYVVGADNGVSTVQNAVNGPVSLVKNGTGIVTIAGTNTYSGSTNVNNGTLIFNTGQQQVSTSSVTVSSYTDSYPKMIVDNSTFAVPGNVAVGIARGSSGELSIQGSNSNFQTQSLFVIGNGDPSYGTGASTKSSVLRIADGAQALAYGVVAGNYGNTSGEVDVIGHGSKLIAGSYNLYVNGDGQGTINVRDGGQISNDGQVILGSGSGEGFATLNIGPNGTLVAGDVSPSQPGIVSNLPSSSYQVMVNNGTIQNYQGISLHSAVNMTLNGTLYANTLDQQTEFSGVLSGAGGVDKQGTGLLTLSGNNSFQGSTTVESGNLLIIGDNSYKGDTIVQHGSIQIGDGGNTGSINNSPNIILENNDASVVFNRTGFLTIPQKITGSGGVTQDGPGSIRLTGNNDYKGETWVQGGTLLVNGDQSAATGDTKVNRDGILAGTGTLGGDGLIQKGGRLAPGDGEYIGSLNINKNLSFDPQAHQTWLVGRDSKNSAASSNFINVGGNLSLAGPVDVVATPQGRNMKSDGSLQDGIYRTYNYNGTLSIDPSFHLDTAQGVSINTIDVQTSVRNQVNLVSNPQHLTFWSATHIGDDGAGVDHHIYGGDGFWAGANAPKNSGGYLPSGAPFNGAFDKAGDNWTDINAQTHGPWASGQFAVFERKAGNVTVQSNQNAPVLVDGMQFANTDGGVYTLSGDPIYASSNMLTIRVGDGSSVSGSIKALVNSPLDESMAPGKVAGLTKLDPGTLILGANNNYHGQTLINGGTLQLGNGGETGSVGTGEIANNGTLAVNRSNGITLGQTISGSGDVWQNGSGTTTLTGNNSYTGATHVTNGTLALVGSGSISQSAGVRVDGGTANLDISSVNNHGTAIQTLSGQGQVILGGNDLTITNGNRTVNTVYKDDGETINVTSNRYSGDNGTNIVYIDGNGKVVPESQYNADNGDRIVDLNKDGSVVVGNRFNGSISGNGGVNITGGQEIFSGQNTFSGRTSVSSGAGLILTGSLQGGIVDPNKGGLYNQGTVTVNGGTIAGKSINDDANAVLKGINHSNFGDIENNSGKLILSQSTANSIKNNGSALLDGSTVNGSLDAGNNGNFNISSNGATIGSLAGAGAGHLDGNMTINNAQDTYSGSISGSGGLTVNSGKQTFTGDSTYDGLTLIGQNAIVQYGDGGTTGRIKGLLPGTGPQIRDDGQLVINHSNLIRVASGISGSGSFSQIGAGGTTVLSGNNSYTGGTTVSQGTLQVDGDQSAASGDTTVQPGGNLAGNGILGGNVYIKKGGTLSPGDAPGTVGAFTIQGNLTEENDSQQKWDIGKVGSAGGAYNDYVDVKGDLTLGGQLLVNANLNGPNVHNGVLDPGVYRLYSYGKRLSDNGVTIDKGDLVIPDGYSGDYFTLQKLSVPNQVNIVADAQNLNFWDGGNPANHTTNNNPFAGNGIVDGGSGDWVANTGNNWTSSTGFSNTGWILGRRAIFINTPGVVTVKDHNGSGMFDPVVTTGMQFIGGDAQNHYKIIGDDLFIAGENKNKTMTIRVGDGTIDSKNMVAEIGSALNDSQIAGGGGLTKSDLGTLILTADNAYRGGTTIDAGTLQLGNGGSSGWAGSGDITNNGVLAVNRSNDVNFTQGISGSGSFVQMGGNDSSTTLSAQNSYMGSTNILNGTLKLAGKGSIAQSSGIMSSATGHLDISGISASETSVTTLGGQGSVNLGDRSLTLSNANRTIRVQFLDSQNVNRSVDIPDNRYTGSNGNHLIYTDADGKVIASNEYDPNKGDMVFDLSKNGQLITDNQYDGVIFGKGGSLTIASGAEILSGANTYTGMTSVHGNALLLLPGSLKGDVTNAGIVDVNGGSIAGTTTNNGANAVLTAENNASLGDILNNDGRVTLLSTAAQNITNSSKGTFSAAGGQLESLTNAGISSLTNSNNITQNVTNTGKLTIDGSTVGGTLYSNGGSFTVTNNKASVGSLAGSASGTLNGQLTLTNAHDTYSGVLSGNNQQVEIRKGTQAFSGQNSYTGDTLIGNDATLQLGNGEETGSVASGTIRDEGNLVINRSNDYLLSQALLGGGNVKQIGAGRTIITSPNAYTGFTSIEHGRLALQEGGSVLRSSGVHVNNDGVFDISEIKVQPASSGGRHGGVVIPGGTLDVQTGNDGKTAIVQALDGNGNIFLGDKNLQISNANAQFGNNYSGIVSGKGVISLTGGQEVFSGKNTSVGVTSVSMPATLTLTGSLLSDAHNAGKLDVNGGSIVGQTINNGANAFLTAEHNASFNDIVNTQGRVALTNATAGTVTNAAGQTFSASGGKLASVTNSGTATLGNQNIVSGDVTNKANLTLDGNTVDGTLYSNGGSFAVTKNNSQIGSLTGTANGNLTGELTIANAHDTYDGVLLGGGGANVSGGKQIFSADQQYSGDTTIGPKATLQLGTGGTTGSVVSQSIHDDGTLRINRSNEYDLSQVAFGTGNLVQAGTGRTVVSSAQTYIGATTVEHGVLALNDSGSIESSAGLHVLKDGQFDISGTPAQPLSLLSLSLFAADDAVQTRSSGETKTIRALDGSGNISLGDNTLQISNANEKFGNLYSGVIFGTGGVNITSGKEIFTGQHTYIGTTAVSPNAELTLLKGSLQGDVYNEGAVTVDGGQVAGQSTNNNANAVLTGRNKAQFGDINNRAGQVLLHQGTANSLTNQGYVLLDGATITGAVDTGKGTFDVSAQNATVGSLTGAGKGTLSGLLTIQQGQGTYGGALQGTGGLTVNTGKQIMTGDSTYSGTTTIGSHAVVQYGDGGTSGRATGSAIVNDGQLMINHSDRVDMASAISGSGRFDQVGSGVTVLSGNNSYTGDTTVEHGTLQIDGDQSKATGAMTVQSGATLAGHGTLGGNATVQSGATLSPGDVSGAVGGLTIKGNLVAEAGSQQKWTVGQVGVAGGAYNDYVNVQGNLTLGGTLAVNVHEGSSVHGGVLDLGVYRLYDYSGNLYGPDGKTFTNKDLIIDKGNIIIPAGYQGDYLTLQTEMPHQVNIVVDAKGLNFWDGGNPVNHGTNFALGNGKVDGGDGEWVARTGSNWTTSTGASNVGWLADGRAIFGAQTGTVTVRDSAADGSFDPVKMTGIQFISGDAQNHYKITGDDLYAVSSNTVIRVGDGTGTGARIVAELNSALNDSQVKGGTALTKTDLGTLILTADNHYQGSTTIDAGTLQLGNGGTTGATGSTDILNNGTLAVNRSNDLTLDQKISGTGSLAQRGSGSTTLTKENSYSGVTDLIDGTLNLRGKGSIAQSAGVQSAGNARFDISGIDAEGTSIQTLGGQGQVHLGDKTLTLSDAKRTVGQDGQILTDNHYSGVIDGQGGLTLAQGMEILSGDNRYSGETGLDKGTVLQIGAGGTTGSAGSGAIRDDGTFIVNRSNDYALSQNLYGSGDFVQVGTGRTFIEAPSNYTGTTTVEHGTLALAQNGAIQKSAGVHVASDGSFDISGLGTGTTAVQALDGTGSVALGSKTLQLSNANAPFGNVYAGVMSGDGGSLSITGGQEVLTGANTYTGTTSIASGAGLQLTGSLQSAVSNAGTFDVNGGRVAGQAVNDGSHALMTAENNAHLSDIVNNQGVVKLVNSYAQQVTNATGAQFSATSGQLAGLTNAGEALLTARNTVTGDVANSGHLTLDGNTIAGTLSAQNGTFTVTNNNVAVGSLAGNGQGVLNGQLAVTNGHDTFGGDLSGAGTVQIDGGKQTFSGGNDYTGATTVARGTLALAQNGAIQKSAGVHVASDGAFDISALGTGTTAVQALDGNGSVALGSKTLQLSNANALFGNVYSGVMSGDGSFSLTGGREILTGDSTYHGATQIAKGAQLVLGNNTTTGSLQSNMINVDGDLTINRRNRAVLDQKITGSGSLIQDGDGVTQLNGMSSYSGSTTVNRAGLDVEGALSGSDVQVNAGTLSGTGMAKGVTMERGTIFAPAGDGQIGTFSVGNGQNNALVMKDGSTLSIDVKGSSSLSAAELNDGLSTLIFQKKLYQVLPSDQVRVTGSAQIGNNVELSLPKGGTIKPGEAFTLITSTNGVNGTFSGISGLNSLSAFVKPEFIYSDDHKDLTLLLERNSLAFADIGGTRNERATGTALDHVSVEKGVVQAALSLNERDARQATNSLSGELHASARTALIQDSYYIRKAALDRLDSADCDGASGNGIGTADFWTGQKTNKCLSARPVLWGESYGSLGSNSGDGNATSLHHSAAGFVMGADAPVVAQWRVGGMVGYGHSMFNQKSGSSGSGHSDNITIGAYAGRNLGKISFKMGASYTWNLLSTRRTANVGSSYSSRLTSSYTGGTAQAFGEVGYKIHLNRTIIEPFANVAYVNQNTDSYREHGGDAALRGRTMNTGVTFSTFGVRASSAFMIGKTQIVPHVTAAYRRAYGLTTPTARELFASSGSSTMDVAGVPLSKDSAVVDTGVSARLTDRINVDVSYIGQYGNQSVDSGARANINVQF